MTTELFRNDSYLKSVEAIVTAVTDNGFVTDQTVFYPRGGGQPGDTGTFAEKQIIDTVQQEVGLVHVLAEGTDKPNIGDKVTLALDWERRYRLMRMHSCLHLLCSLIDAPVTGGSIGEERSRLDFDLEESPDKEALTEQLKALISQDHTISIGAITDAELDANPDLVRTMSVKPPRTGGTIRMIRIGSYDSPVDYQPCGGTHVASTVEIGAIEIAKIEKKGRQNRRVSVRLL